MHRCPPPSSQERGGPSSGARLRPALICIHERRVARGGQGWDLRRLPHQDSACSAGPLLHPSSDSLCHRVPRLLSLLLACAEERDPHGRRAGDIHSGLCSCVCAHETLRALEGTVRGSVWTVAKHPVHTRRDGGCRAVREDAGLSAIEAWYGRVSSSIDMPAMADHLANVEKADVPSLDVELPPRLVEVLKVYATSTNKEYSSYLRHIRRCDGRADARLASLLRQSAVSDGLDLYLLCLFGQII